MELGKNTANILTNTGWLLADRTLRLFVSLLVGVWIARYLGPEEFGLLSFAIAYVGMFATVGTLGLRDIVVRDIVRNEGCVRKTIGTSFVMRVLAGR